MSTFYLDLVNGNDANNGSSWAQAWKTLGHISMSPGDTVRVAKSSSPVSIGNATWTNLGKTVTLAAPVNTVIDTCDGVWTATSNIGVTNVAGKLGNALRVFQTASFITGKAAYKAIGPLNLSSYQQISFWVRTSSTIPANAFRIALCSDTLGDVAVNNFSIGAMSANMWIPVTVNLGSAMGSDIRSIALYVDIDVGSIYLYLDQIIACKAPNTPGCLTFNSLISKNTAGEPWYPVQMINGMTVDLGSENIESTSRGYFGTHGTAETFSYQPYLFADGIGSFTKVGTKTNRVRLSGGWNTATNLQDGHTWIDGLYGTQSTGIALNLTNAMYADVDHFGIVRYAVGITGSPNALDYVTIDHCHVVGCGYSVNVSSINNVDITNTNINNGNIGLYLGAISNLRCYNTKLDNLRSHAVVNSASSVARNVVFDTAWVRNNGGFGITLGVLEGFVANKLISMLNGSGDFNVATAINPVFINSKLDSPTDLSWTNNIGFASALLYDYEQRAGRFMRVVAHDSIPIGLITDNLTGGVSADELPVGCQQCLIMMHDQSADTTLPLIFEFFVPVQANIPFAITFRTKLFLDTPTLTCTVYDSADGVTKLLDAANVSVTDTWQRYTSSQCTATRSGLCKVRLEMFIGVSTTTLGIVDVSVDPQPQTNLGDFGELINGTYTTLQPIISDLRIRPVLSNYVPIDMGGGF